MMRLRRLNDLILSFDSLRYGVYLVPTWKDFKAQSRHKFACQQFISHGVISTHDDILIVENTPLSNEEMDIAIYYATQLHTALEYAHSCLDVINSYSPKTRSKHVLDAQYWLAVRQLAMTQLDFTRFESALLASAYKSAHFVLKSEHQMRESR